MDETKADGMVDHRAPTDAPPRRRWLLAPLLALFVGPIGHIAIGYWRRACAWYAIGIAVGVSTLAAVGTGHPRWLWIGVAAAVVVRISVVIDVARLPRIHPLPRGLLLVVLAIGCVIFYEMLALKVRAGWAEAFKIPSGAMIPTLEVGDHIFATKWDHSYRRGDVIVFRYPPEPTTRYVKRIVGVGGDTVEIHREQLSINGQPVARRPVAEPCPVPAPGQDPFLAAGKCSYWEETLDGKTWRVRVEDDVPSHDFGRTVVPYDSFFVLGDNRDESSDSRVWGAVAADLVEGKASFIWWSSQSGKPRWEKINQPVR